MKIREIFDAMNVTTSDYANRYCVVKKIYDVIVRRSYQKQLAVYIYINLYETFQKCDNIDFKHRYETRHQTRHRYDSHVLKLLR